VRAQEGEEVVAWEVDLLVFVRVHVLRTRGEPGARGMVDSSETCRQDRTGKGDRCDIKVRVLLTFSAASQASGGAVRRCTDRSHANPGRASMSLAARKSRCSCAISRSPSNSVAFRHSSASEGLFHHKRQEVLHPLPQANCPPPVTTKLRAPCVPAALATRFTALPVPVLQYRPDTRCTNTRNCNCPIAVSPATSDSHSPSATCSYKHPPSWAPRQTSSPQTSPPPPSTPLA
jgi:hypothetical protein